MNLLGNLIICGLLQVTLVVLVAKLASSIIQWQKRSSMPLLTAALAAIVLLTIAVAIPVPSWLQSSAGGQAAGSTQMPGSPVQVNDLNSPLPKENAVVDATQSFGLRDAITAGIEGIRNLNQEPTTTNNQQAATAATLGGMSWSLCFLMLFCLGVVLGLLRLIGGLVGVTLLVRGSRPISNTKLLETVDLLAAQTSCTKAVSVRESSRLATAATVGWRRPVILLSQGWREWSDEQLRSVLAHELAHVARGDFLTTVLAQLGLVLHFYHPLVHWLVSRLRLEQELAADAIAAKAVGDPRVYLRAIGELALAQSSEQLSWPAHTFLPTRKTFMRRVEMLRDMKLLSGSVPIALRVFSLCTIAAVGFVAVGIRPSSAIATSPRTEPQQAGLGTTSPRSQTAEAHYAPADAIAVALVRPQELLPMLEKSIASIDASQGGEDLKRIIQSLRDCSQMTVVVGPVQPAANPPLACAFEFANKASREAAIKEIMPTKPASQEKYLSFEYEQSGEVAKYLPDDRTLILGELETVKRMMLTGKQSGLVLKSEASIAVNLDAVALRPLMQNIPSNPVLGVFNPLWKQSKSHLLTVSLHKQPATISLASQAESSKDVDSIATSLGSAVTLLKSFVQSTVKPIPGNTGLEQVMKLIDSKTVSKTDESATLTLSADAEVLSKLTSDIVAPAVLAAKTAAQRAEMTNNLKILMLALHNYESAYRHFPPAIVVDPTSGVARSWRVEILPFLDGGQQLYDEYKKDQPWDSPANKAVLEKMPNVFRHPSQPKGSTSTSVFAAYGKGMIFEPNDKDGTKLSEVTDGTSSTVAIVEGRKEVPWTKPEEILFDLEKGELPTFGTTNKDILLVGFGDGSVHALAKSIDPKTLKALFTKAGGEL